MKTQQFTNVLQSKMYEMARPRYTKDIFTNILKRVSNKSNLLDIACGTGQLLFPLSEHFETSIGIDVSKQQIDEAKIKANKSENKQKKIYFYDDDLYKLNEHLENNSDIKYTKNMFDLVVIGQAFHWFEEEKLLNFIKSDLLAPDGVLAINGYQKQHFKPENKLNPLLGRVLTEINPYFECDVKYNDSGYLKTYPTFKKYFKNFENFEYTEVFENTLENVFYWVQSVSAYVNFKKENEGKKIDPLEQFEKEATELGLKKEDKVEYCNFYFSLIMDNKI